MTTTISVVLRHRLPLPSDAHSCINYRKEKKNQVFPFWRRVTFNIRIRFQRENKDKRYVAFCVLGIDHGLIALLCTSLPRRAWRRSQDNSLSDVTFFPTTPSLLLQTSLHLGNINCEYHRLGQSCENPICCVLCVSIPFALALLLFPSNYFSITFLLLLPPLLLFPNNSIIKNVFIWDKYL